MKSIICILLILIHCLAVADYSLPSENELKKSPAFPMKFMGEMSRCNKSAVLDKYVTKEKTAFDENGLDFILYNQVDLNLDGVCEIYGDIDVCGTGGCSFLILQAKNMKALEIGQFNGLPPIFLEQNNGWLQMESWSRHGSTAIRNLYSHAEFGYSLIRTDYYEYDNHDDAKYIKTEYPLKK